MCHGDQFRGQVGFDPCRISGEYRETLNGVLITDHIGAIIFSKLSAIYPLATDETRIQGRGELRFSSMAT